MNLVISMYSSKYQENNDNFDYYKCITWSPYERIEVKPVASFKELCKGGLPKISGKYTQNWIGVRQCLHLIGLDNDKNQFLLTDGNIGNCVFNTQNSREHYNFYCVLSMRFDPVIHKMNKLDGSNDEQLIMRIKNKAFSIISDGNPKGTACSFFRSLGAEDMVIIFLSNSIKDIINVVDLARNMQFKYNNETIDLFSTVYMFTGLNNPSCDKKIGVNLIVNLHLKKHHNMNEIKKRLERVISGTLEYKEIFRGKGTIQLEIPSSVKADVLFKDKEGILNEGSEFYKDNFYGSRVYFKEETSTRPTAHIIDEGAGWNTTECLEYSFNSSDLPVEINDSDNDLDEMTDVAKFIFVEYERMMANNRFCQWKGILKKHHEAMLKFVRSYMKYDRLTECRLLEQMQSSLHLINQACSPASDIPYHNYYYSGSFSDLLKAYYGILNILFKIIYRLPHADGTSQHDIVFAVRLEAIARIQSEIFTLKGSDDRIIVFSLPYDSFWNYANNIKLLAHEAFHYAAPYDRIQRNQDILNIIFKILLTNFSQELSDNYSKTNHSSDCSHETREWNSFMLNAFRNDTGFKNKLYNDLYRKYELFFTSPAPEWNVVFCKNGNLSRIIRMVNDSVNVFVKKNAYDVKVHINEQLHEFKLAVPFSDGVAKDPSPIMCNKIISTVSTLNTAVKEAFCDVWSIKITKVSVSEYIQDLFNTMIENKGYDKIRKALLFDRPSLDISMFSLAIRLYLLLYYEFIESGKKKFNPAVELRNCVRCENQDKVPESTRDCITQIAKYNIKNTSENEKKKDDLYEMAFRNLHYFFSQKEFVDDQEVNKLRTVYNQDLSSNVDEKSLSLLVNYASIPLSNKNVSKSSSCFVKTFGKDYDYALPQRFIISSLSDYITCINYIYELNKGLEHRLWYRGICHIGYSLLPSLFRNCDDKVSLYANQANIMKKAYFNSPASVELWNQSMPQKMASLQHYGVPTNLLDFSLDQFVALHFAVNPDLESDRRAIDDGCRHPVVYVFNPIGYSVAMECLKSGNPQKTQKYNLSPVVFDFNQNSEEQDKYFLGDMSYEYLVQHTNLYNVTDYVPNSRANLYPVPMVIEHTNPRIKAQSGVFVAYPLDAQPQRGLEGEQRYHYMDLLQIQTNYNALINRHQIDGPFLFTIEILQDAISSIRAELMQFNINSGKYYPELSKLLENMKN